MTGDEGFTLPEVVIASMMTLMLGLPAFLMLQRTNEFAAATRSRLALNAEARQVLTLLGSGSSDLSAITSKKNPDGFTYVEGLRSMQHPPPANSLRSSGKFTLTDGPNSITGDAFPSQVVQCTGPAKPIPDCTNTEQHTIQGWLGSDPVVSVTGNSAAVLLTLTDPFQAQRPRVAAPSATERYRTIFNLNAEAQP